MLSRLCAQLFLSSLSPSPSPVSSGMFGAVCRHQRHHFKLGSVLLIRQDNFCSSRPVPLSSSPQGSILGPFLCSLYMLALGSTFGKHGISNHCFADDVHIYLPSKSKVDSLANLLSCLRDFRSAQWLKVVFFFHLRLLGKATPYLPRKDLESSICSLCAGWTIATPFFKALNGLAPSYLSELPHSEGGSIFQG